MWGCTELDYADEQDLLLLVVVHQSETIFASSSADNASDTRQCGAMSEPCISLNVALPHIIPSVYSNLLIDKSAEVTGEASACDVSIKSLDAEGARGSVVLNSSIGSKTKSLVSCSSRVKMEFLTFLFGSAFSSSHSSLLPLTDVNLWIADTIFAQEAYGGGSGIELNCLIVEMSGGRLTMSDCTFAGLCLSFSCLAAKGGQYCSFADLNVSEVNCGELFDFSNFYKPINAASLISSCIFDRSALILRDCKDSQWKKVQLKNEESKASLIVLSSDGSGGHSNVQYYHSEFDSISVLSGSLFSKECQDSDIEMNFFTISNAKLREECAVSVASNASTFHLKQSSFQNITRNSFGPCCLAASSSSLLVELENCTNQK
ncbi:uncharacterized protein MONOS_93 [Monocercomonoides exilis]|uniref:uncharacterized protein n=1 Tax=Monocercomonoides exilis TaxID=2049356 RepID=UPI003559BB51|nr:hypothetical protein MONOS_93 [Monocercomonoides exilis]